MSTGGKHVTNVLMTCSNDAEVGGVQTLFRDLVHWLEENDRRVHLLYPAPLPGLRLIEKTSLSGRTAFYCAMPAVVRNNAFLSILIIAAYLPITFFHLSRLIRRKKIDVINCHYLAPYSIHLAIAARLLRVPLVVSVHGSDVESHTTDDWTQRVLCRWIVRGAHRIVACSKALAKRTFQVFPEVGERIAWAHNALDQARCADVHEIDGVPQPFVLSVCRHVHVKGVDTLLRAFALIRNDAPDVSLVLVGDGPLLADYKLLAKRLEIGERVVFAGAVPNNDVPSFLAKCTLFVLPSRAEGFGLVLLEAAYHRKPIVCTRVGGSPEIVSNGVNGLLVEPDNPAEMAAEILKVLRDNELAQRLGNAARERVLTHFLWRDRIKDYIDIYEGRRGPSLDKEEQETRSVVRQRDRVASVDLQ